MGNKHSIKKIYSIKEKIGSGSFADVHRCVRRQDGKEFAVKVMKKDKLIEEEVNVHDEVEIMQKINHPNCMKLHELYEDAKRVYIVVELLVGGELFDRIVKKDHYSEAEAAGVIKQITQAIQYIHSKGVTHRDLKPENLLYDDDTDDATLKITDFGLAKYVQSSESKMNTPCGTPGYVAPEILQDGAYGQEVDLWSIGVILYILLCGFPPFYDENHAELYKKIKKGQYTFPKPYWTDISEDAKDLVRGLLTVDHKQRYTSKDVLKHPWICGKAPKTQFGDEFKANLKKLLQRKWKAAVKAVVMFNRLRRLSGQGNGAAEFLKQYKERMAKQALEVGIKDDELSVVKDETKPLKKDETTKDEVTINLS